MKTAFMLLGLFLSVSLPSLAQNNVNNPWSIWYPEIGSNSDAPNSAFRITSSTNKVSEKIGNNLNGAGYCSSFTIGNDARGYVYYHTTASDIRIIDPKNHTIAGTIPYTTLVPVTGINAWEPHSIQGFYISATNKHYIAVSGTGLNLSLLAIAIFDVTNPASVTLANKITLPNTVVCKQNANSTSSGIAAERMPGLVLTQGAYTSAATKLYCVVDDGVKAGSTERMGLSGANILHPGVWLDISDPLVTTTVTTARVHETNYTAGSTVNALYPQVANGFTGPHQIAYDKVNDRVFISTGAFNTILSFNAGGTSANYDPTNVVYKAGSANIAPAVSLSDIGFHSIYVSRDGTAIYTGRSGFDLPQKGEDRALRFNVLANQATITVRNEAAASPSFSVVTGYDPSGVQSTNFTPDEQYLYSATIGTSGPPNGPGAIFSLNPGTMALIQQVQKPTTGGAVFDYLDPHSYAYTLSDFSDAPASYGIAVHNLVNYNFVDDKLCIGSFVDGDTVAASTTGFNGDDIALTGGKGTGRNNDEDGITTTIKTAAKGLWYGMTNGAAPVTTYAINNITVKNTTANPATLTGWIDFNHDGVFAASEGVAVNVPINSTSANLSWTIPSTVTTGPVLLRLRLTTDANITTSTPAGIALDGEVEDHKFPPSLPVSGNVFADANGNTIYGTNGVAGSGENGTTAGINLYAYLVKDNIIVDSARVGIDGAYSFPLAPQNMGSGNVVIGTNSIAPGAVASGITNLAANLPSGWVYIGTSITTTTNGTSNSVNITLGNTEITGINFGIERTPVADAKNYTVAKSAFSSTAPSGYPSITGYVNIPAGSNQLTGYPAGGSLTATDAEDCAAASSCNTGKTFSVETINSNTKLYYNNGAGPVEITAGTVLLNFDPAKLVIYGQNGATSIGFTYAMIDAAGKKGTTAPYTINTTTPLPVDLVFFEAHKSNGNAILEWEVGTEENIEDYTVEYSTDGRYFNAIGKLSAKGSGSRYHFTQATPAKGTNYYQLAMNDLSSGIKKSGTVMLIFETSPITNPIYPNPVSDLLYIDHLTVGMTIVLYNMQGQAVYHQVSTSEERVPIDMSLLPAGSYMIVLTGSDNKVTTSTIMKK